MEANIQIFQSPMFGQIRVSIIEGKPMFVANDIAAMLGYSNRYDAINRHCKGCVKHEGVSITTNQYGKSTEQKVEISFIPESDVYRLVMRSKLPEAEQFQDWVCEEVLPAIRKTGGYMVDKENDSPEEIMARALLVAQDTMKRKEARIHQLEETAAIQEQQIKIAAPKVEYHDTVLMSADTYTTNQIAKELGISAVTLNKKLRSLGVQYSQSGQWLLYAKYQNKGYTKTHTYTFTHATTGQPGTAMRTVWTEAGRKFIHGLLKQAEKV
ncbi:MAG: phage antirepressor KilAC domain-containing protein [Parabacteroides sp.]|nr:phage antirepressor KilAC domain-containing protein [Parabacteroides sp.]